MSRKLHLYEIMINLKKNEGLSFFFNKKGKPYLSKNNSKVRIFFYKEDNFIKLKCRSKSICLTAKENLESKIRSIKVSINEDCVYSFLKKLYTKISKNETINKIYSKMWNDYYNGNIKYSSKYRDINPIKWVQYEFQVKSFDDYLYFVDSVFFNNLS